MSAGGLTTVCMHIVALQLMVSTFIEYSTVISQCPVTLDKVYVMPYCEDCSLYRMSCRKDIAPTYSPGFNCTVADVAERPGSAEFNVWFNILGARPINVSMEVVWVNHYPVDLHPSYLSTAKSSTILHVR